MKVKFLVRAACIAASCLGLMGLGAQATDGGFEKYYTNLYGYDGSKTLLGRGINLGNYMEAGSGDGLMASGDLKLDSNGSTNGEGFWSNGRKIQSQDFRNIRQGGFKSVRIPMRWTLYASLEAPYTVNPAFAERAKKVVDAALREGLNVVINVHHYTELMEGSTDMGQDEQRIRLKAVWAQIAALFPEGQIAWKSGTEQAEWPENTGGYPKDRLVFELLNEPNKAMNQYALADVHEELLAQLRAAQPDRVLMLGSTNWSGFSSIDTLFVPEGCTPENTIITVHNYEPFKFTHQGAPWLGPEARAWKGTRWTGSARDMDEVIRLFDKVVRWNSQPGRGFEIYMGEFGVFSSSSKEEFVDDQKRWTAFIAREAEARGFSWAYWEYDQGFGAWNPRKKAWRTHLLEALIPGSTALTVPAR